MCQKINESFQKINESISKQMIDLFIEKDNSLTQWVIEQLHMIGCEHSDNDTDYRKFCDENGVVVKWYYDKGWLTDEYHLCKDDIIIAIHKFKINLKFV